MMIISSSNINWFKSLIIFNISLTAIGARRHRLVERKKINSNKKSGIRQQHRSTPSLPPSYGNNNPRPLTAIGLRRRRGKSTRRM